MGYESSPHRKSVLATTALVVVLAADKEQGLNWGGVNIDGYVVWIFVGLAHLYFSIMWWSNFGFEGGSLGKMGGRARFKFTRVRT